MKNRREFIKRAALGTAALSILPTKTFSNTSENIPPQTGSTALFVLSENAPAKSHSSYLNSSTESFVSEKISIRSNWKNSY